MKALCLLKVSLIAGFLICGIFHENASSQTNLSLPESLGNSLGFYEINSSDVFEAFENFQYFRLQKFPNQDTDNPERDLEGKVYIRGEVRTKDSETFKFKEAFVRIIKIEDEDYYQNIEFETVQIKGISYKFIGKFAEKSIQENGQYTKLRGTLTKFKNEKEVASQELPFFEYAIL